MVHDRYGRRLRIAPYIKMQGIAAAGDARMHGCPAEMHRQLQSFINFKAVMGPGLCVLAQGKRRAVLSWVAMLEVL